MALPFHSAWCSWRWLWGRTGLCTQVIGSVGHCDVNSPSLSPRGSRSKAVANDYRHEYQHGCGLWTLVKINDGRAWSSLPWKKISVTVFCVFPQLCVIPIYLRQTLTQIATYYTVVFCFGRLICKRKPSCELHFLKSRENRLCREFWTEQVVAWSVIWVANVSWTMGSTHLCGAFSLSGANYSLVNLKEYLAQRLG